jgi:hypothetical protein
MIFGLSPESRASGGAPNPQEMNGTSRALASCK